MEAKKQLQYFNIKGYKSISDQIISLSALNVLIGQNGAGKSNFISIFKFLRNIVEGRLKNISLKAGAESLLYYGSKVTNGIVFGLNFDSTLYWIRLQPASDNSLFITHEGVLPPNIGSEVTEHNARESLLSQKAETDDHARQLYEFLRGWRVYHFHDTSETALVKKYASVADYRILSEDASNLAPFLYIIKQTQAEYYERIVKTIQLVIPSFNDFVLDPNPLNKETIRLEWTDKYSDKVFTANELSDGSLRFICMATLLLQKELPRIIVLDEPELGLHPSAITVLAGLLHKASKRSQVIISTQSVSLVNEFDAEDIIVVEKKETETTFKRLDAEKLEVWLNEYSLGELWDKNIIGGNP